MAAIEGEQSPYSDGERSETGFRRPDSRVVARSRSPRHGRGAEQFARAWRHERPGGRDRFAAGENRSIIAPDSDLSHPPADSPCWSLRAESGGTSVPRRHSALTVPRGSRLQQDDHPQTASAACRETQPTPQLPTAASDVRERSRGAEGLDRSPRRLRTRARCVASPGQ